MSAISAKTENQQATRHRVVFVVYPDIALLDLAGPLTVFAWAKNQDTDHLAYEPTIVSRDGGSVLSDTLISVDTQPIGDWKEQPIDTLVIVGGDGVYDVLEDHSFVADITNLVASAERVCSICSGALMLAATGVLDGRRAVTHWDDAEKLRARFPAVQLEADPIYVKDGKFWTSAGVTAGTDMALAIVAEDLGQGAALERARSLVTYMVRPGGQSQFSPVLERQSLDQSGKFEGLHQWITENLAKELHVEQLAEQQNMSVRNFHRLYLSTMGITPAKAVETIRLEAARDLLETTGKSMKVIANRCGFGGEERMRRAFTRLIGISPSEYRQRFRLV